MSSNLRRCLPFLQSYCSIKSRKQKAKFLKQFEQCIMKAAQEISVNTLRGNVMMTDKQKKRLRRYKTALETLSRHSIPRTRKRKVILQSGTGLFAALLPLVISAVAGLGSR